MEVQVTAYTSDKIDDFVDAITAIAANTELKFVSGTAGFIMEEH